MMHVTALKGTIPVQLPGSDKPVVGVIASELHEGFTVTVERGPGLRELHEMLADGQIVGLAFHYIPVEQVEK